jgi:hypothetical protein
MLKFSIFNNSGLMQKLRKMDHIEVYTGLRRSQSKKMAALKAKCGKRPQDILVIGGITARRVSVFNSIKMEINMKECGQWTRSMARAHTGEMRMESSEENTPEIGSKIRSMVVVPSSLRIVIDMMVIG